METHSNSQPIKSHSGRCDETHGELHVKQAKKTCHLNWGWKRECWSLEDDMIPTEPLCFLNIFNRINKKQFEFKYICDQIKKKQNCESQHAWKPLMFSLFLFSYLLQFPSFRFSVHVLHDIIFTVQLSLLNCWTAELQTQAVDIKLELSVFLRNVWCVQYHSSELSVSLRSCEKAVLLWMISAPAWVNHTEMTDKYRLLIHCRVRSYSSSRFLEQGWEEQSWWWFLPTAESCPTDETAN